jgi:hypothetical protein
MDAFVALRPEWTAQSDEIDRLEGVMNMNLKIFVTVAEPTVGQKLAEAKGEMPKTAPLPVTDLEETESGGMACKMQ